MSVGTDHVAAGVAPIGRGGPLHATGLAEVMGHERGSPEVAIGLLDGAVATDHEALVGPSTALVHALVSAVGRGTACENPDGRACAHGTAVAGILVGDRGTAALGVCPGVRLLVRPIFVEDGVLTSPDALAGAIVDCIDEGAGSSTSAPPTTAP